VTGALLPDVFDCSDNGVRDCNPDDVNDCTTNCVCDCKCQRCVCVLRLCDVQGRRCRVVAAV
jgi:hypothetical protein